ncbi:uncharacterized protein LOC117738883 isoform X2 [Cyclopterus lumpus]|uniref:uncharacterized protein LOC117738883 isoform X2 n=1 Tax=Cyclopterus lumpus TaxID=8103 RepID=UPI00148626EF|nr:uncharacterized protein LOC117738883 isoform X2 [Cyclopterus lumpus]
MERISLCCQVCLTTFDQVSKLKAHVFSQRHKQKSAIVFNQDVMKGSGIFPFITLINQWPKGDIRQPILGLTLCFSLKMHGSFYLCHVCEETCPSDMIVFHLSSIDHCRNYFSHTNPNALRFSWIPSKMVESVFRPEFTREVKKSGGQLQLFELPKGLLEKLKTRTYSEVMRVLRENEKLLELLEAVKPKQMMIQTYQKDLQREHPLLGLQHLVECICFGKIEKRHYLCTLCHLTLAAHAIVQHVLSFDHIFCYFRAWHPSTLLAKEIYKDYTQFFAYMMLDFAKQAEQIHGTALADLTQVRLEPTKFESVNFTCYADALKELESIRKENKESSLIAIVTPGNKLALKEPQSIRKENKETPGNPLEFSSGLYTLRCQNCRMSFLNMSQYCSHLSNYKHKLRVKTFFGGGADSSDQREWTPSLDLYKLVKNMRLNQPLVGVPLVVTCVCSLVQEDPIYLCFACQDCFTESFLRQHFDSHKHLINTLLYQNPWRLTLGWEHRLDVNDLRSMAWEEQKERPHQMMLKIFDMPNSMIQRLFTLSFPKVMECLSLQHIILKRDVPPCETYSKLKENNRFPLLGRQFLVIHEVCVLGQQPTAAFLCLLCQRRLSEEEFYAHEFSRNHIATFIDRFHPGSLESSSDDESLLDLAKQAGRHHSISHVQVIKLKKPISEPCTYSCALFILSSANKGEWKTKLDPPIIPKMKLVPRKKLKDEDKDHVKDNVQKNSRMTECLETTSQTSTNNSQTVEVGAKVTDAHSLKSEEDAEKGEDKGFKTSSEDTQQSETCQAIKEEEMSTASKPSGESTENSQNTDKNEIGNERIESREDVLTQKREISQKDTCPVEAERQENNHKQQRFPFKEEPQNLPISGQKEVTTNYKGERGKPSHKTAKDHASCKADQQQADQLWQYVKRKRREPVVGLGALLECSCAEHELIYLCMCCSLKIPEKDIISHVIGVDHQKMYLVGLQKIPPPPGMHQGKTMRHFASLFEREHGYGEAQVVELDDEIYNNLSKQDFDSVIQTLKVQDQKNSGHALPSTSALPGVQPVDTIVTLRAQHKVMSIAIDDSEDSESQSSSVTMSIMTENTSNTTKVPPDSNEVHIKASLSPSPNTLSKRSEDKAEIISNTTVGPFKMATTSKVVGRSETAASLDSKCTTKSSNSTPAATKSTAPISKLKAATSSCNTANTKSRDTASKCTATIPISTATTSTLSDAISTTISTTTSVTTSKTPESKTRAATKVRTASCKAAAPSKIKSTVVFEASGRTEPGFTTEKPSKSSESKSQTVVASQIVGKSFATAKMTDASVEGQHIKASVNTAHMKNLVSSTADVAPNAHKSVQAPAATHLTMPRNPPAEPPLICTNEKRPSGSSPKVGLNQLIKVSCGRRKQVYCQLCSARLLKSEHTCSATHQLNYVKMKFPQWTCKPSELESKLQEMVNHLAAVEGNVGSPSFPTVKVTIDVYKELADLSAEKALERLKAMLERGLRVSSPTTSNPEIFRRQVSGSDQHESSSPDYESESSSKGERSLVVGQFNRAQSMESSEPEANDQILDQLNSCSVLNQNEPIRNPCIQGAGVAAKMEKPQGCAPPATDAQTPGCKETPEWRQQQEKSHPEVQDTRKVLEGSRRTSPVTIFNPDQLSSDATVNTKQQNQPRLSQKAERALPMILLGESTEVCSHLSIYLKVLGPDREPIIGMDFVWECRGPSLKPFFLCESCKVMISLNDICQHMVSNDHQINFILGQKSQFMYFWPESYLLQTPDVYLEKWMKLELLKDIAQCLSEQERYVKTDAQRILLGPELYERVRTAPFSKALEIVKNIKKEQKLSISCQPSCTLQRKEQPDPRSSVSPHQRPIPELPVKQAGVRSESTSFSGSPQTLSVSSSEQHLPTRKRPAVESIETLMRYCTNHPNDPTPAKRKPTYNEPQPIIQPSHESVSESTSVNPAATFAPLTPQEKNTELGSDEQDILAVDCAKVARLIALVRERKSALNAFRCMSAPGNGETATSCANNSSKSGVQGRCGSKSVQTTSKNPAPAYALEKFNSSLDGSTSARDDLLFWPTGAKAVCTMLPYASAADPSDPQHQRHVNAQTTFGNTSQSNPSPINCAVINSNVGHIPQPQDYSENHRTGAHQLPINSIVTVRSNQPKQQFIGGNNEEDLTELNRGSLVTHSLSSVAEICSTDVLGGYGQYNQMVYVTNRQSGYFSTDAVGSYTTPGNPPVQTGSSFQCEGYPTGGLYFPNQIHPDQETTHQSLQSFKGNSLETQPPTEWVRMGMQQQQLLLQQQHQHQQLLLQQQQQWQHYQ